MLELKELRFKNFGRFLEEQSIDFSSLSPFTQIDGLNHNTKSSSGSGKSTVFMALDYLLGFNHRPATILQCRYTEEPLWVQGTFSDNVIITRSKSLIQVDTGTEKLKGVRAEEFIDVLIGMPRDLFRKVVHKRQKEGGFFLNFTPKEMHDFLIDCIGLSKFKEKYKILEEKIEQAENTWSKLESDLTHSQASLSATQDAILALGLAPIQDMHKEVIIELKEKYDRSTIRFHDVEKKCESIYNEFSLKRPIVSNGKYDGTIRESAEKRRDEIEAAIEACFDREKKRQEEIKTQISSRLVEMGEIVSRIKGGTRAKTEATKIASEIKSIRAQSCPTCAQVWATEGSAAVENQKLEELTKLKVVIMDSAKAEKEKTALDQELVDLKALLNPIYDPALPGLNEELNEAVSIILQEKEKAGELFEQQTKETQKLLNDFTFQLGELQNKHKLEINQARGQMDVDRRVLEAAVQKFKSYEEAKARFDRTFQELKIKELELTGKIASSQSKMNEIGLEQIKATESLRAVKTYVSFSFDQALDDISNKATKIIRCIPNMSNATIQFVGTKENKDGKIKEEVNAVISVDGEPAIPINSLSGGEESAMDLAVDLAVIDYIETRSGMGMNVFILDEPFNGLGTVEIEMALDVLKNSNINKKLIIVDHNPEVKQMVHSRLVVERTGLTSRVVL